MIQIRRPIKTNRIGQLFGENRACTALDSSGKVIVPYQVHAWGFSGDCPTGYTKLYSIFGMLGHNGYDMGLYHGEPLYHSGNFEGTMRTHVDNNGGIGVDVVSNEPLLDKDGSLEYIKLRYWHLKSVVGYDGKHIKPGDLIAYGDNTGISGGNHVHFALKWCDVDGKGKYTDNGYRGAVDHTPYFTNEFVLDYLKVKAEALSAIQLARKVILQALMFIKQWKQQN